MRSLPRHYLLAQALLLIGCLPEVKRADRPPDPKPDGERHVSDQDIRDFLTYRRQSFADLGPLHPNQARALMDNEAADVAAAMGCPVADVERVIAKDRQPPTPLWPNGIAAAASMTPMGQQHAREQMRVEEQDARRQWTEQLMGKGLARALIGVDPSEERRIYNPPFAMAEEFKARLDERGVDLAPLHAAGAREVSIHDEQGREVARVSMDDYPKLESLQITNTRPALLHVNGPSVRRYMEPPKPQQPGKLTEEDHRRTGLREARRQRRRGWPSPVEETSRAASIAAVIEREHKEKHRKAKAARKARRGW